MLVALIGSSSLAAQEVIRARDVGYLGPVERVQTYIITYSFRNGAWRAGARYRSADQLYDTRGRLYSTTTYQSDGDRNERRESTFHPNGELETVTVVRFDSDNRESTTQVIAYASDGTLVSDITENSGGQVQNSWVRSESNGGYTVLYYQTGYQGVVSQREEATYDTDGRVVSELRRYSTSSSLSRREYSYDDAGRLGRVTHRSGYTVTGIWDYSYSAEGLLTQIVHTDSTDNVRCVRSYQYGASGILQVERAEHTDLGGFEFVWTYEYDESGNVINDQYEQTHTDFAATSTYEHNGERKVIDSRSYDTFGRVFLVNQYSYDGAGSQTRQVRKDRGILTGTTTEYAYDKSGRLSGSVQYDLNGTRLSGSRYVYDVRGNRIEVAQLNSDGSFRTRTRTEFEYDSRGNWTSSTELYSDNAAEIYDRTQRVTTREIAYRETQ